MFVEINRKLDHIRNENTFATIPEMNKVKTALFTTDVNQGV
jgi:hypothetical protein